jgi:isopenicillin-N epimerase
LISEIQDSVTAQDWSHHWSLDHSITFLNHGSFGACPRAVLEQQQVLRSQLEQEPVRFFALELEPLLDAARQQLASFVGATANELAFVPNATTGINTVLQSLVFQPGDELLTTNHEYNASRNALNFAAERSGSTVVVAEIPFPLESSAQIVEAILAKVSDKTKLVLLDHITSQTALIFPIKTLVQQLSAQGIDVLIDGAHAPGMIPLNLRELGAAFYTGNCHKWLCAPKGAAFLYVRTDRQDAIRPLAISHGANSPRTDRSRFHLEFDWVGTSDPTPYLCIPTAIKCLGAMLPGGWPALMERNRSVALSARTLLCQQFQIPLPCPDQFIGSMACIPLAGEQAETLQTALFQRYKIEIPVIPWQNRRLIRISVQLYNQLADYQSLANALAILQAEGL